VKKAGKPIDKEHATLATYESNINDDSVCLIKSAVGTHTPIEHFGTQEDDRTDVQNTESSELRYTTNRGPSFKA
jgi:hypothetical protein